MQKQALPLFPPSYKATVSHGSCPLALFAFPRPLLAFCLVLLFNKRRHLLCGEVLRGRVGMGEGEFISHQRLSAMMKTHRVSLSAHVV